jgi:hypothetical protein
MDPTETLQRFLGQLKHHWNARDAEQYHAYHTTQLIKELDGYSAADPGSKPILTELVKHTLFVKIGMLIERHKKTSAVELANAIREELTKHKLG